MDEFTFLETYFAFDSKQGLSDDSNCITDKVYSFMNIFIIFVIIISI